jgi:hypothetical protein
VTLQREEQPATQSSRRAIGALSIMVAALAAGAAQSAPLDAAGFHPGMSLAEVVARMKAVSPALEIKIANTGIPELSPRPVPWMIAGVTAEIPGRHPTIERITAIVTMPPTPPVLWGLARSLHFADGQQPLMTDMAGALRAKYGRESMSYGIRQIYWGWDEKGAPMSANQMRQCAQYVGMSHMTGVTDTIYRPNMVSAQQQACQKGKFIEATLIPSRNPDVASDMEVAFTDMAIETTAMAQTRAARTGAQNSAAAAQVQRAKQNRPGL